MSCSQKEHRSHVATHGMIGLAILIHILLLTPERLLGRTQAGVPQQIELTETFSLSLDGENGAPRDVRDIASLPGGEFILLDGQSRRLYSFSKDGEIQHTKRVPAMGWGGTPSLLAVSSEGAVLVTALDGEDCAWYSRALEKLDAPCGWRIPLSHRTRISGTSEGFLVSARMEDSEKTIHMVSEDLLTTKWSTRFASPIERPNDSLTLNWGLGTGTTGEGGSVWAADHSPLRLELLLPESNDSRVWEFPEMMIPYSEFKRDLPNGDSTVTDLFERTTALEIIEGFVFHVSYFPLKDFTSLRLFDDKGVFLASAQLPFQFHIFGVSTEGDLIAVSYLNDPILAIYEINFTGGGD